VARVPRTIHRIKVTLRSVRPPVWRRLTVPSWITLADLHEVIQVAMGWENCHLHQFELDGLRYSAVEFELEETRDEQKATLSAVAPLPGSRIEYWYDFGDDWYHDITVEAVEPAAEDDGVVRCLTGRRACPPEDCGGPWGYANLLDAIDNASHPDHPTLTDWMDAVGYAEFDPAKFDQSAVDEALKSIKLLHPH
jgi:Plasmid pRiA4b ORF-3-like protein